jgi:uncharacterized membrane protein
VKAERKIGFQQVFQWGILPLLAIAYPIAAHLAAASTEPGFLDVLVAVTPLSCLAFLMAWRSSRRKTMLAACVAGVGLLYAASGWLLGHYRWVFLLEHAGLYTLLCWTFGKTLQSGQVPMITGFARMVHGELSTALLNYTRWATWAWTAYFGVIAGLSMVLFWLTPIETWSTFANLMGGPLLILMFVGEYVLRCFVLPVGDRAGPLDAIRAYRQASSRTRAGPQ